LEKEQKAWATIIILQKLPAEKDSPIGETSPNPVTLTGFEQ
jgi:hypothetical protein